ncbi:MAG: TM2 domain-containing protein [Lentisphaeria bacterium]|nr:TM2 domain-containing protein [Lentisphaeria bacterium]
MRTQWKDRYIYTILGLTGGAFGIHNFYLGYTKKAIVQLIVFLGMITVLIAGYVRTAGVMFAILLLWITGELFLVSHEPDGDRMNDEARPLRILLIALYWFVFILLPLLFFLYMNI